MCVRKPLAMSEPLHVSFMGTGVCSPLSDATFILTASGPEERRGLTLTLKKLYFYIKVHCLVSSPVFLSLRELLRVLASSSWAGLVLSCAVFCMQLQLTKTPPNGAPDQLTTLLSSIRDAVLNRLLLISSSMEKSRCRAQIPTRWYRSSR